MSTVLLIARKEILDHLLSLKFHVCMAAMTLLLGASAFVMYRDYQLRMENFSVLRARALRAGEDPMAVVQPSALSVFAKGLDDLMTRGYTVSAYLGIEPHQRQGSPDSLFALFVSPDLLYIVKVLLSLVALLFAYDAVSSEKEDGTLKLILSSAVSRGQFVAGKLIGGLASVIVPFGLVLLAVLAALLLRPDMPLGADQFARIMLMAFAAVLYTALFFALGVLVSSLARSSASSLMVLLLLWATLVFAIPNAGNLIAEQISPLPSTETQEMLRRQQFAKNRFLQIQSRQDSGRGIAAFNREYDRLIEDYRARLDAMTEISKLICRVSPAATLSYVYADLAGTGLSDQRQLTRGLLEFKNRTLQARGRGGLAFEFRPRSLAQVLAGGALVDLALLATACLAAFAAAVAAFLRTDPR